MKLIEYWKDQGLWRIIERSDGEKIKKILQMTMRRYEMLNPETEILYATLPKYSLTERKQMLDSMYIFLLNEKTDSLS